MSDETLLLRRGALKQCPRCGAGGTFSSWTKMNETCGQCGLRFEREEGYWVGAMTVNVMVALVFWIVTIAIAIAITWPDVPYLPLIAITVVLQGLLPILFMPFSRTLWLATDMAFFNKVKPLRDGASAPPPEYLR